MAVLTLCGDGGGRERGCCKTMFCKDIGTLSPKGICVPSLTPSVEFLCLDTVLMGSGGDDPEEQVLGDGAYQCPGLASET